MDHVEIYEVLMNEDAKPFLAWRAHAHDLGYTYGMHGLSHLLLLQLLQSRSDYSAMHITLAYCTVNEAHDNERFAKPLARCCQKRILTECCNLSNPLRVHEPRLLEVEVPKRVPKERRRHQNIVGYAALFNTRHTH